LNFLYREEKVMFILKNVNLERILQVVPVVELFMPMEQKPLQ